jgi:hypothetical protein
MSPYISVTLRDLVRRRARNCCEYCQTSEWLSGLECEVDHIVPRASGGLTIAENLCLACASCNGFKQAKTSAIDPESSQEVFLFHPRQQRWYDHFTWSEDSTYIIGLTPYGRVTIEALKLNHALIVGARSLWVRISLHPPALASQADEIEPDN